VVLKWFRSRAKKREEPAGESCAGCLAALAGSGEDQLRALGAIFMEAVGWFCDPRCERQYRFRFRIRAEGEPITPAAAVPTPSPQEAPQITVEELMEKLRERRRRLGHR
jgi:hypothetical protein